MLGHLKRLSGLMVLRACAIGLILIQSVVLTRTFGAAIYGQYAFMISFFALLVIVVNFGMDQVLLRERASSGGLKAFGHPRFQNIKKNAITIVLGWLVLSAVIVWGLLFGTDLFGIYEPFIVMGVIVFPFFVARRIIEALGVGAGQVERSVIGSQLVFPAAIIIGGLSISHFGDIAPERYLRLMYAAAIVVSAFVAAILILVSAIKNKESSVDHDDTREPMPLKQTLSSGNAFMLASLGIVMTQHIDVFMMSYFSTPEDVAIVRIASRLAEMTIILKAVAIMYYKPIIANSWVKESRDAFRQHVRQLYKIFLLTGVPVFLIAFIFAPQLLSIFGSEFVAGVWVARIYLIGFMMFLMAGPASVVLEMSGSEKVSARLIWVILLINFVLNLILIPLYGATGCAVANAIALSVLGLISARAAKAHCGVKTGLF